MKLQDVVAGQVELMFANVGNAQAHVRGYQSSAWFGLFGPGQMPPERVRRIGDAARQAVAAPEVRRRIELEGATAVGNAPEEFGRFVQEEITRWAQVVKYSGARAE